MYYDVHTHHSRQNSNVVAIENIHQNFGHAIGQRKVSMGLHPWYVSKQDLDGQFASLSQYASMPEVAAIGECGLDKITSTQWAIQQDAFSRQIQLAVQLNKPLIIHCVKAFDDVLSLLRDVTVPVIFHGINNKLTRAGKVIDHGHYLSFGKALLRNQPYLLETFRAVPMERLFLETDDAEASIGEIYKSAALIKNIDEKEVALQLERNFKAVFDR